MSTRCQGVGAEERDRGRRAAALVLVDLSVFGAQVVSPAVLKPNQRLRFSLTDQWGAVRCNAVVAWATFELPRAGSPGPHYRAGLAFLDAEADAVTAFTNRHRRQSYAPATLQTSGSRPSRF